MKTPEEYYEDARLHGETYSITGNPTPDYRLGFYQDIFRLMEGYHKHCLSLMCTCGGYPDCICKERKQDDVRLDYQNEEGK